MNLSYIFHRIKCSYKKSDILHLLNTQYNQILLFLVLFSYNLVKYHDNYLDILEMILSLLVLIGLFAEKS